jgi:hypothetical protein
MTGIKDNFDPNSQSKLLPLGPSPVLVSFQKAFSFPFAQKKAYYFS